MITNLKILIYTKYLLWHYNSTIVYILTLYFFTMYYVHQALKANLPLLSNLINPPPVSLPNKRSASIPFPTDYFYYNCFKYNNKNINRSLAIKFNLTK